MAKKSLKTEGASSTEGVSSASKKQDVVITQDGPKARTYREHTNKPSPDTIASEEVLSDPKESK